ncbi:MAG: type II toxin-antitoxin system HipA family toxin [Betaproteobacteria bacterium]|jgi:serine/threonine-protein kinase HipA|nr:type II toxin-antitoxin system HipA family toxin [Betaproteobacteria bacterium]
MATKPAVKQAPTRTQMDVFLGKAKKPLGRLIFVKDGQREFSQFAYSDDWLADSQFFDISPDLNRQSGYQLRKPPTKNDTCFFLALADTEPDAWGRRVIARAHAKARAKDASLGPLTEADYLACVDDFSRVGALRLQDENGRYLRSVADGARSTPAFLELEKILLASRAVELSKETTEDLAYLQGKGTSLGGMRPKCTILDSDGALSLGKFSSVNDERSITRGEVLALRLAQLAGIDTARARVVMVQEQPVAMIRRFDRTPEQNRIPYISGATLLQANRDDEHSYTEIIDVMRSKCENFVEDARQLWRRLVFNHLITNVDDHLQNIGFLYSGNNQWRLAPAFDLNPFPDKDRESKTWLSEDSGPISSTQQMLNQAARFELSHPQAQSILEEVATAVKRWKDVATSVEVGLQTHELNDFKPAFESNIK